MILLDRARANDRVDGFFRTKFEISWFVSRKGWDILGFSFMRRS